mgnify:CR=1 FL=1
MSINHWGLELVCWAYRTQHLGAPREGAACADAPREGAVNAPRKGAVDAPRKGAADMLQ